MTRKERIAESLAHLVNVGNMLPTLYKVKETRFAPVAWETGDRRFIVTRTDNANARAIGRNPKWTVTDNKTGKWERHETLTEAKKWIKKEEAKS